MDSTTDIATPRHSSAFGKRLMFGFIAGFMSVLIFHQLMLALLHLLGVTQAVPFRLAPVPPFGVPAVISSAFWGGLWGILFALVEPSFPRSSGGYWLAALLLGAIPLVLVAWFIAAPLKGVPAAGGWRPAGIATGLLVNAAWGVGTAFFLRLLSGAQGRRP
jgi:hypothetical protein